MLKFDNIIFCKSYKWLGNSINNNIYSSILTNSMSIVKTFLYENNMPVKNVLSGAILNGQVDFNCV